MHNFRFIADALNAAGEFVHKTAMASQLRSLTEGWNAYRSKSITLQRTLRIALP